MYFGGDFSNLEIFLVNPKIQIEESHLRHFCPI